MRDKRPFTRDIGITIALAVLVLWSWYQGLFVAPTDRIQGEVYRIIFVHVPAAFTAFFSTFLLLIAAIVSLVKRDERWLLTQRSCVEVGLLFTFLTLATGSIWGRPTWGTWWTWDARLTTTLILAILQASFLLLYNSFDAGSGRIRVCSILSILIAVDVPIIYKSVTWWRTLHQPAVLFRKEQGQAMSADITNILIPAIFIMVLFSAWLMWLRYKNLRAQAEIDALSYEHVR